MLIHVVVKAHHTCPSLYLFTSNTHTYTHTETHTLGCHLQCGLQYSCSLEFGIAPGPEPGSAPVATHDILAMLSPEKERVPFQKVWSTPLPLPLIHGIRNIAYVPKYDLLTHSHTLTHTYSLATPLQLVKARGNMETWLTAVEEADQGLHRGL